MPKMQILVRTAHSSSTRPLYVETSETARDIWRSYEGVLGVSLPKNNFVSVLSASNCGFA